MVVCKALAGMGIGEVFGVWETFLEDEMFEAFKG